MTRIRKILLRYINDADKPVTANDVFEHGGSGSDRVTVYRALAYFEKNGLIEAFTYHCEREGTLRYYYPLNGEHTHFFHCSHCHTFIPLGPCTLHDTVKDLERHYHFEITRHVLYFTGICETCVGKK